MDSKRKRESVEDSDYHPRGSSADCLAPGTTFRARTSPGWRVRDFGNSRQPKGWKWVDRAVAVARRFGPAENLDLRMDPDFLPAEQSWLGLSVPAARARVKASRPEVETTRTRAQPGPWSTMAKPRLRHPPRSLPSEIQRSAQGFAVAVAVALEAKNSTQTRDGRELEGMADSDSWRLRLREPEEEHWTPVELAPRRLAAKPTPGPAA